MKRLITTILASLLVGSAALFGQTGGKNVTVGKVTFLLADDYEIVAREKLPDGEACMIAPKGDNEHRNRLILKIHPDVTKNVNGLTGEEVKDMLNTAVDQLAGVFVRDKEFKIKGKYKIQHDDNAKGTYFPNSYCYLDFTDPKGASYRSFTQAVLVNGHLVSGCSVALSEGYLAAFSDILSFAITGALL